MSGEPAPGESSVSAWRPDARLNTRSIRKGERDAAEAYELLRESARFQAIIDRRRRSSQLREQGRYEEMRALPVGFDPSVLPEIPVAVERPHIFEEGLNNTGFSKASFAKLNYARWDLRGILEAFERCPDFPRQPWCRLTGQRRSLLVNAHSEWLLRATTGVGLRIWEGARNSSRLSDPSRSLTEARQAAEIERTQWKTLLRELASSAWPTEIQGRGIVRAVIEIDLRNTSKREVEQEFSSWLQALDVDALPAEQPVEKRGRPRTDVFETLNNLRRVASASGAQRRRFLAETNERQLLAAWEVSIKRKLDLLCYLTTNERPCSMQAYREKSGRTWKRRVSEG